MQYTRDDVRQQLNELGFTDINDSILDNFMNKLHDKIQQNQKLNTATVDNKPQSKTTTTNTPLPHHLQRYNDASSPTHSNNNIIQPHYEHGKLQRPKTAHNTCSTENTNQSNTEHLVNDYLYQRYNTNEYTNTGSGHVHSNFMNRSKHIHQSQFQSYQPPHNQSTHPVHHDVDSDAESTYSDESNEYIPTYSPHTKSTRMLLPYTGARRTDRVNRFQEYQQAWKHDKFLKTQQTRKH